MKKAKHLSYIAFLSLMLASCSVGGSGESLSLSEESEPASVLSSLYSDDVSVPGDSAVSSSRSSRERNPFSLPATSSHYTVSIYQSYLIPGKNTYGNPTYDFSVTVEAGHPLYSTPEEHDHLIEMCNPIYHPNGGIYDVIGFYSDETCKQFINYTYFSVTSDIKAYYYCKG